MLSITHHRHLGRAVRPRHRLRAVTTRPARRPRGRWRRGDPEADGRGRGRHPQGGEGFGAEVRVMRAGGEVLIKDGCGHRRGDQGGRGISRRRSVVTTCHPQITFLRQIDRRELPGEFVADIENWRSRSGTEDQPGAAELPEFNRQPGIQSRGPRRGDLDPRRHRVSRARLPGGARRQGGGRCRSRTARSRRCSTGPWRRRAARHVVFTSGARNLEQGAAPRRARAYADRLIDRFDQVAPNFKRSILHRQVIGPYDMEHEYHLLGGNIFHGELTVDQPVPHASRRRLRRLPDADPRPLPGLVATHAGGGVNGLPRPSTPCARCARTACCGTEGPAARREAALYPPQVSGPSR